VDNDNRNVKASSGFLIDVARCFRNRTLQAWGDPGCEKSTNSLLVSQEVIDAMKTSLDVLDSSLEDEKEVDPQTLQNDKATSRSSSVIELKSYRVPCPRTSSGIFSTRGFLSCFGGCQLRLVSSKSNCNRQHASSSVTIQQSKEASGSMDNDLNNELDISRHNAIDELEVDTKIGESKRTRSQTVSTNGDNEGGKSDTNGEVAETQYLKSYADLLLHLRQKHSKTHADNKRKKVVGSRSISSGKLAKHYSYDDTGTYQLHFSIRTIICVNLLLLYISCRKFIYHFVI
jgi:hypothetical protein